MINIESKFKDVDDLGGLDKFESRIKQSVLFSGVAAMANVMYEEVKTNASKHVKTGLLLSAVYRAYSPESSNDDRKVYKVSVRKGGKGGAPHWHFLEYGTSRQRARPFIRPAFDKIQSAIEAGTKRMSERLDELT